MCVNMYYIMKLHLVINCPSTLQFKLWAESCKFYELHTVSSESDSRPLRLGDLKSWHVKTDMLRKDNFICVVKKCFANFLNGWKSDCGNDSDVYKY